jgi:LacI family transcriptional regulator
VIAMNDRVAMGVYQAAQQLGLSIPGDLSVVSFDDSDLARWLDPGLSSLAIPHYEMGRRAVEILLDDAADNRIELLPMPFRARDSVAKPAPSRHRRTHGTTAAAGRSPTPRRRASSAARPGAGP